MFWLVLTSGSKQVSSNLPKTSWSVISPLRRKLLSPTSTNRRMWGNQWQIIMMEQWEWYNWRRRRRKRNLISNVKLMNYLTKLLRSAEEENMCSVSPDRCSKKSTTTKITMISLRSKGSLWTTSRCLPDLNPTIKQRPYRFSKVSDESLLCAETEPTIVVPSNKQTLDFLLPKPKPLFLLHSPPRSRTSAQWLV